MSTKHLITAADFEKICQKIEQLKGHGAVPLPVVIVVVGFYDNEMYGMFEKIAEKEKLGIVDFGMMRHEMRGNSTNEICEEFNRRISNATLVRDSVMVMKHFGHNQADRKSIIRHARQGMKSAKTVALLTPTEAIRGIMYFRQRYGEVFSVAQERAMMDNLSCGLGPEEDFDWVLEAKV